MARSGTAASRPAIPNKESIAPGSDGSLTRERKLETKVIGAAADVPLPYSPPLEDYVLPQTLDIVVALRKLASY